MNTKVEEKFNEKFQSFYLPLKEESLKLINDCVLNKLYPLERALALEKNNLNTLSDFIYDEAIYNYFIENDIKKTKQSFYLSAKISYYEQCLYNKDESFFVTYLSHCTAVLLSDNLELITKYSKLTYDNYEKDLKNGYGMPFIQAFLRNDKAYIKQRLEYHKLHLKEKYWFNSNDLDFFEALLNQNNKKMEESIMTLATKQHKKRNKQIFRKDLISIPALTYAKLAYIKGYKLDIVHPLIPKELLPVKPNEEYWEYDFMKEGKFKNV